MSDLKEILDRAQRAIASVPTPPSGFERLVRLRDRRERARRIATLLVSFAIGAGGTLLVVAALGGLGRTGTLPLGRGTSSASPPPSPPPQAGKIVRTVIDGEPAQRLGPFWFAVTEGDSCLRVQPVARGPSWTFQDAGHDCVESLGGQAISVGLANGSLSRDGSVKPPTQFSTVYGLTSPEVQNVEVVWGGGRSVNVPPHRGRFLLVWEGYALPLRVVARSAAGTNLGAVSIAQSKSASGS